jgi:hypothetical protein
MLTLRTGRFEIQQGCAVGSEGRNGREHLHHAEELASNGLEGLGSGKPTVSGEAITSTQATIFLSCWCMGTYYYWFWF